MQELVLLEADHKAIIRLQDCGPSVIRRQEDSWMLRHLAIRRLKVLEKKNKQEVEEWQWHCHSSNAKEK